MLVFSFLLWFFFNVRTNTTIQINEIPPKSPPIRSPVLPGESVESVGSAGCDSVDKVDSDSGLELGLGTLLLIDPTPGLGLELLLLAASGLGFGPLLSPALGAEPEPAVTQASIAIDPFEPTNMSSDLGALELTQ
jgi:hypothetical protein